VGWWLTAAGELPVGPSPDGSSQSIITALIAVLGTVLVALVTVGLPLLLRRDRTNAAPPVSDPQLGEKLAVLVDHDKTDRQTLNYVDRRLDRMEGHVDVMWKWFSGPGGPLG
jgi:hypothetical protein